MTGRIQSTWYDRPSNQSCRRSLRSEACAAACEPPPLSGSEERDLLNPWRGSRKLAAQVETDVLERRAGLPGMESTEDTAPICR